MSIDEVLVRLGTECTRQVRLTVTVKGSTFTIEGHVSLLAGSVPLSFMSLDQAPRAPPVRV